MTAKHTEGDQPSFFLNSSSHASAETVICHENQPFPAALSDSGKLHFYQKSQFAIILEAELSPLPDTEPETDIIIMDGSALVNALPQRKSKALEDYALL